MTSNPFEREYEALRDRLEEAEATIRALTAGEVDAVVVAERDRVLTLEMPDMPYRLAVEQMPHPAVTLTRAGTVIYGNKRFADLLGISPEAMRGVSLADFVAPNSRRAFETLLDEGCRVESRAEITLDRGESTKRAYLAASPFGEGAFGSCMVISDLTSQRHYEELQQAQAALRESERQLRLADRRKDEFLATLVHELRAPVAPMRNALEIMRIKGSSARDLEEARNILDRQLSLMVRLLDDLRDVSRIAHHTLEVRTERVELSKIIDAALETNRPLIETARHQLAITLPERPIYLRADPVRLSQVFGNILSNAVKYTQPGGRIELKAWTDPETVSVSIKDTGIGIPQDVLPRIFEIFTQANQAIPHAQGGLGIGLSLVKGVVELHGGTIEAKSEGVGRGSEFIVRLPLDRRD